MSKFTNCLRTLSYYKTRLRGLIRSKGVTADSSDKLDSLINKVNNIKQRTDVIHGTWNTVTDSDTFTYSGLTFMPARLGISSQQVLSKSALSSEQKTYIGALSIDFNNLVETDPGIFTYDSNGDVIQTDLTAAISAVVTTREVGGVTLYDLSISLSEYNESHSPKLLFMNTYEYEFVITSKEWFTT